ncbi:MAG: zinc ribbon domain-containing protein [Ruminiclostridium sp.]
MKKCPYCAEEIQDEAIVCGHCGKSLKSKGFMADKAERIEFIKRYRGIILNIIIIIGLFFPVFTIPLVDDAVSAAKEIIVENNLDDGIRWAAALNASEEEKELMDCMTLLDGSLNSVDYISFFGGWVRLFKFSGIKDISRIILPYLLFIFGEALSVIFLIKSILNLDYDYEKSLLNSKRSVVCLLYIYLIGIFFVLVFNSNLSSPGASYFISGYLKNFLGLFGLTSAFSMDIPVASIIFLALSFAAIGIINMDFAPKEELSERSETAVNG